MPAAMLVDTNVLLRIAEFDPYHDEQLLSAIKQQRRHYSLCVTFQNIAEFWNVATRPEKYNGLGRPIGEVADEVDKIVQRFMILPETRHTFLRWRSLVMDVNITGVLVHDARLAAIMLEHEIQQILTLNARDFARFPFITPIDPREAI